MDFGLDIAQQRLEWDEVVRRARLAEDLGFTGAWGFDHLQPMYGEGPGPCFEGMTTLAALAGHTSRIRLGLLVTGITYRHPSMLAVQAVTIDHASHGRLDLALGAAWFEPEHRALGIPFPSTGERFDLLEESLEVITGLFTGEPFSFEGEQLQLHEAQVRPVPVQQPHPPIWIGGTGPKRTLPLVAHWADVWHGFGSLESLGAGWDQVRSLAEGAGRDPASITRAASISLSEPVDTIRRRIDGYREAGFGYLIGGWPEEGQAKVEEFASALLGGAGA